MNYTAQILIQFNYNINNLELEEKNTGKADEKSNCQTMNFCI